MRNQRSRRHGGGQRIDSVEHAAVARQNGAAVLDAALTFQLMIDSPVSSSARATQIAAAIASTGRV